MYHPSQTLWLIFGEIGSQTEGELGYLSAVAAAPEGVHGPLAYDSGAASFQARSSCLGAGI